MKSSVLFSSCLCQVFHQLPLPSSLSRNTKNKTNMTQLIFVLTSCPVVHKVFGIHWSLLLVSWMTFVENVKNRAMWKTEQNYLNDLTVESSSHSLNLLKITFLGKSIYKQLFIKRIYVNLWSKTWFRHETVFNQKYC